MMCLFGMLPRVNIRDRLVEKCDEDVDGNEMIYNATLCNFRLNRRV